MTHFSHTIRNISLLAFSVLFFSTSFAQTEKVECDKDKIFTDQSCDVCYKESFKPTKTSTGWTAEIAASVIPWEHSNIELNEVIGEAAQKRPEMIASSGVKVTPSDAEKIWDFHSDIVWYSLGSSPDREFFIEKGKKVGLYTLKPGVKLSVSGTGSQDTLLFKVPLAYAEFDKELWSNSAEKNRNICVLNTFSDSAPTTSPVVTTPTPPTPPLNAAGPEEKKSAPSTDGDTDEEEVKITPEQTKTKAGPGMWIFLLLAFVFSSAWTAWKKQKI